MKDGSGQRGGSAGFERIGEVLRFARTPLAITGTGTAAVTARSISSANPARVRRGPSR